MWKNDWRSAYNYENSSYGLFMGEIGRLYLDK